MSLHIPAVFEHITLDPDALAFAVAKNANIGAHYDWRTTYPVLAQLDKMNMRRTATIFPDDCPNNAHDAYVLEQIGLPIDTGVSLMQAVAHHIPAAIKDLADKTFAQWFSLSPVHWRAGRDHVNLVALSDGDISIEEAKVLLASIAPKLAELGWHIHVASANTWYIRTMDHFDYHAPSLQLAQSDQLESFLPHGRDLKRWQTLLTEIQMMWFEHPINQARAKRNQTAINSLWLYGGINARAMNSEKLLQFNALTTLIRRPNQHEINDIHAHLAWLNLQLSTVIDAIKDDGQAIMTFLGETWQQDVFITQPSWTENMKGKFSSSKKKPLQWLEQPTFDFLAQKTP